MHCPRCGTAASEQQKFCRSCGFNVEQIAPLLAEPLTPTPGDKAAAESGAEMQDQLRRTERWLSVALAVFFVLLLGGISWMTIAKVMIEKGQFWAGLAFLLFIASAATTLYFVARREELREELAGRQSPPPAALPPEKSTAKRLPESPSEPVPSVTEHTTKQLAAHEVREAERNRSAELQA